MLIPGSQGSDFVSLDQDVQSAALRWRRDLPGNANLGVLYTGREGDDYSNHLVGFDGVYRLDHGHALRGQIVASRSRYPTELDLGDDTLEGEAYYLGYTHSDAQWFWRAQYNARSPGFRADSGFIPQVGCIPATSGSNALGEPPRKKLVPGFFDLLGRRCQT